MLDVGYFVVDDCRSLSMIIGLNEWDILCGNITMVDFNGEYKGKILLNFNANENKGTIPYYKAYKTFDEAKSNCPAWEVNTKTLEISRCPKTALVKDVGDDGGRDMGCDCSGVTVDRFLFTDVRFFKSELDAKKWVVQQRDDQKAWIIMDENGNMADKARECKDTTWGQVKDVASRSRSVNLYGKRVSEADEIYFKDGDSRYFRTEKLANEYIQQHRISNKDVPKLKEVNQSWKGVSGYDLLPLVAKWLPEAIRAELHKATAAPEKTWPQIGDEVWVCEDLTHHLFGNGPSNFRVSEKGDFGGFDTVRLGITGVWARIYDCYPTRLACLQAEVWKEKSKEEAKNNK